jgi:predicted nucleic acid-binding protein
VTGPALGLLDTTVFIAREAGRGLDEDRLPEESVVSVVTLAELRAGVLAAADTGLRAQRLATLSAAQAMSVLGIDEAVAEAWALLRVRLAELNRRVNVNDLWIASTGVAHDLPVVTQDNDFDPFEGMAGLTVVRV